MTALVHEHRGAVRKTAEEFDDGRVLGRRRHFLAEEREQLDGLVVAEDQRVADDRVAALMQARQERIVRFREIDAEQRGEKPAQPEVLEQHDLAAAYAAAGGHVQRQREAAPRAMPARQRRCGAQPFAPARRRERRFEGYADPAGEPFEAGFRGDCRSGQQVRMGDAIFERREHAFEVREEAREEVGARGPRPVDPDRFLVAAVHADRFADQPPCRGARLIRQQPAAARLLDPNEGQRRIGSRGLERRGELGGWRAARVQRSGVRRRDPIAPARPEIPRPRRARLRDRAAAGSARHSRSGSHTHEARAMSGPLRPSPYSSTRTHR